MLNEARTLLLNAAPVAYGMYVGEEPIAADFKPASLPDYLLRVRQEFFGSTPDREMLNYRARQLMTLVHRSELKEYLKDFDSRVTYDLNQNVYGTVQPFLPVVVSSGGNVGSLNYYRRTEAPDAVGKLRHQWTVRVKSDRVSINANGAATPVEYMSAGSTVLTLPGVASQIQLLNTAVNDSWNVTALLRPTRSAAAILRLMGLLSEEVKAALFGQTHRTDATQSEQLIQLRRIAQEHFEAPPRLAAYTLAMIYRTREYVR